MFANFFIFLIRIYQFYSATRHPCCRFIPSCSNYAIEAIKKHNFCKGIYLTIKRILKCRPGNNFGYDPVP